MNILPSDRYSVNHFGRSHVELMTRESEVIITQLFSPALSFVLYAYCLCRLCNWGFDFLCVLKYLENHALFDIPSFCYSGIKSA